MKYSITCSNSFILRVKQLIGVSTLLKIIKISQKTNKVIFYFDEKLFDFQVVDELIKKYGMRIKFSPAKNPYVTYILKDINDILKEIKKFLTDIK